MKVFPFFLQNILKYFKKVCKLEFIVSNIRHYKYSRKYFLINMLFFTTKGFKVLVNISYILELVLFVFLCCSEVI